MLEPRSGEAANYSPLARDRAAESHVERASSISDGDHDRYRIAGGEGLLQGFIKPAVQRALRILLFGRRAGNLGLGIFPRNANVRECRRWKFAHRFILSSARLS